jgi:hypothetical protein
MAERRDTTKADQVAGRDPGYRLAAKGREEIEDERLNLLECLFDPASRRRRDLGRVNTNDHACEILRRWKSPKRSTA